jgi:DNA-binding transcriptional MerR regulator
MPLSVSELAARAGISPDTVRYYGRVGLLPETGRTSAGHRYYDDAALERLRFIKGAQWFELRLEEIRTLLDAFEADACGCGHTAALVRGRIAAIDEQRARLEEMRAALCRLLDDPDTTREDVPMTTVLTTELTTETDDARAEEAGPGCGCCIPPPGASAERELRELQARREAVERRLRGLRTGATA